MIEIRWRVGLAEQPLHHQDRSLLNLDLGLFGVFDGVGVMARSGEAAALAAAVIERQCIDAGAPSLQGLVDGCVEADGLISERRLGATTATVVWIGGFELQFVSVGDSRLYHSSQHGRLAQVTRDEGNGHVLDNVLGLGAARRPDEVAPQRGTLELAPGDVLLLVTDGITGDYPPDLITAADLSEAIEGCDDPELAARRLVQLARKRDDRTGLVAFLD